MAEAKAKAARTIEKEVLLAQIQSADEVLVEQLKEQLAYEYPYEFEAGKKSKYSVSEIKHASMVENYDRMEGEAEVPDFILEERESYVPEFARHMRPEADEENGISDGTNRGALRGTAVHRVMACLDFKQILELDITDKNSIDAFIVQELERMLASRLITEEMKEMVSIYEIRRFLTSPEALRMARADARKELFREKPFVMDYEEVLVQGIIDVFWLEDDKIVLLDYKTDRVNTAEELIVRYKTQLELYADALKRVFSTKEHRINDTESLIYSFKLGIVTINENIKARSKI